MILKLTQLASLLKLWLGQLALAARLYLLEQSLNRPYLYYILSGLLVLVCTAGLLILAARLVCWQTMYC